MMDPIESEYAVQEAIAQTDEGLLLRWVAVAEWMDGDGTRRLSRNWAQAMEDWEVRGLLAEGARPEAWQEAEDLD